MSQEQPEMYHYDQRHRFWGLVAVFLLYGVLGYYIQALNIARPKIASAFDSIALISWSVSIPALIGAFVTLLYGKLSDMYGRRIIMLISIIFALIGNILAALSPNFYFLIAATTIASLGVGGMVPLIMAVVGDMFPPVKRSYWIGLLNIPMGIATFLGPYLGGKLPDTFGWSYVFWAAIPFFFIGLLLIPIGIPRLASSGIKHKIDYRGCLLAILASSTTIVGFSFAGDIYPWASLEIIGLLGISLVFWILFFQSESSAKEPILDPTVLRNRSFFTVAVSTFLSSFGQMAMMVYFPVFLQGVLGTSATLSGKVFTPFIAMMAFVGVPVGFLLGKTKRYKYLYIIGFAIATVQMFGTFLLTADSHIGWCWLSTFVGGLGLGAIPTVNTMVVQNAIPKRLMGAAMGALFFSLLIGVAISPAILGSSMNSTYAKSLILPENLEELTDSATMASLKNPDALLNPASMETLENSFKKMGTEGDALFHQTVDAIRHALESGLRRTFLLGAVMMLLAFLLICTIPEVPIGSGADPDPEV
jgi:MFS family permease